MKTKKRYMNVISQRSLGTLAQAISGKDIGEENKAGVS